MKWKNPERAQGGGIISSRRNKHKLRVIVLAALFTTMLLMLFVRLPGMTDSGPESVAIEAVNGVHDLTGMVDSKDAIFVLPPGTTYYPNTLLTPETIDSAVPVSTVHFDMLHADYLSQRFIIEIPDNHTVYTLTFRMSGRHAMRVFANGDLVGQTGEPGATKRETEVWENNLTCHATPKDGKLDIILQSAQFFHNRSGARLATLSIQRAASVPVSGLSIEAIGLLVMGAFICAAVLLLCIYVFQTHTRATLYFALACLAMALRESIQSQAWTYFPLSGNVAFMLEYMSVVLLTLFLSLYLGQYPIGTTLRTVQYIAVVGSCIYGVCLLVTDAPFYTAVLPYYQALLVICIVPGISGLIWTMRRPNNEQAAACYGIAVFFLAAVSDILLYNNLLGNQRPKTPISESAMLVFVLAQTVSLIFMNNRVLADARAAEQRLEVEKEALENLNRMKTAFLGNVSHELKTPLTVMSGYAQTTKQLVGRSGPIDGVEVSRRMKLISSEAERLSLMVGQVLDVTRMEEGHMAMEPRACHIDEVIHAAIETHYPMLNKNANRLEIHIAPGLPVIHADPSRIAQVIVNLISNAVRFTDKGLITVSARREAAHVVVCVADTGTGISPDEQAHLFERYYHKDKTGGGQNTGTGLGLYICKHIVEQHGGRIRVDSKEGVGTEVCFTVPSLKGAANE